MKVGDIVICTSAETGEEKLGIICEITRKGWYKVLLEDGTNDGVWSKEYMRKVRNVHSNRK